MPVLQNTEPVGSIKTMGANSTPSGYLVCDGTAVSRTTYAKLFAAIGTVHGSGDGSSTFNLPDYRGRFLRGWANGSANDPDRGSRTAANAGGATGDNVGSVQGHAVSSHTHADSISFSDTGHNHLIPNAPAFTTAEQGQPTQGTTNGGFNGRVLIDKTTNNSGNGNAALSKSGGVGAVSGPATSTEARPLNANVHYIIKYQ